MIWTQCLIDAKKYEQQSPFNVKFTSEGKEAQLIKENYKIEKVGDINVISYPGNFTVRGYTNLVGYLDTNSIKCVSCRVNIKSKDIDFKSSLIYRYESSKNEYEILKDGAIEKNAQENPIYRLYPRDKYNNTIDYIPQDWRFSFDATNHMWIKKKVDARVNFMPWMSSESTVIRFLDSEKWISTFAQSSSCKCI